MVEETSRTVGRNLARLRAEEGTTLRELSERMPGDHPLRLVAIGEIERGERRVSVDDLTALAVALGVSPVALLQPPSRLESRPKVTLAGTPEARPDAVLRWLIGRARIDNPFVDPLDFARRSLPPWSWSWEGHAHAED